MMLPIKQFHARRDNYGAHRNTSAIKYLVYHYTGNKTDTAWANCNYFANRCVEASAHYFVDEDNIYQSVPDDYVAWSVGSTGLLDKASPYASQGHRFWKLCTNTNSISIEMCSKGGVHTSKILKNAKELGKMLCNKYNITNDHVIRHFDVNGKLCPITMVVDSKSWEEFKSDIGVYVPKKKLTLEVDGLLGFYSILRLQQWLGTPKDGEISGQNSVVYPYQSNLIAVTYDGGGSACISALQRYLNKAGYNCGEDDGLMGKKTVVALQKFLNAKGFNCGATDGYLGEHTAKALQKFLNSL